MANAAGHLRTNESSCGNGDAHNHLFGLDGSVTGKHGLTELGDLSTIICSYDKTAGYSSNSLSSYFHDLGWRGRINGLVQNWLLAGDPQNTTSEVSSERNTLAKLQQLRTAGSVKSSSDDLPQTLGGNYGEATPSDLTLQVTTAGSSSATATSAVSASTHTMSRSAANKVSSKHLYSNTASTTISTTTSTTTSFSSGSATNKGEAATASATAAAAATEDGVCAADKDPWPVVYSNSLSALSAAELVRRIALHRELPQQLQFPGATWRDIQVRTVRTEYTVASCCVLQPSTF